MNKYHAYWNSSKLCWEVLIQEPRGDRYVSVLQHANIAKNILKDQGIKYIDAHVSVYNNMHMLLVADPQWWVDNEADIVTWANESNINMKLNGMILEFPTLEEKMMFLMRW